MLPIHFMIEIVNRWYYNPWIVGYRVSVYTIWAILMSYTYYILYKLMSKLHRLEFETNVNQMNAFFYNYLLYFLVVAYYNCGSMNHILDKANYIINEVDEFCEYGSPSDFFIEFCLQMPFEKAQVMAIAISFILIYRKSS